MTCKLFADKQDRTKTKHFADIYLNDLNLIKHKKTFRKDQKGLTKPYAGSKFL